MPTIAYAFNISSHTCLRLHSYTKAMEDAEHVSGTAASLFNFAHVSIANRPSSLTLYIPKLGHVWHPHKAYVTPPWLRLYPHTEYRLNITSHLIFYRTL